MAAHLGACLECRFELAPPRDLFRDATTLTIADYALELRLQSARQLLMTTFLSVKQIRNEVRMSDAANFSRRFKRRFAMSPSTYRRAFHRRFDQQIAVSTNR